MRARSHLPAVGLAVLTLVFLMGHPVAAASPFASVTAAGTLDTISQSVEKPAGDSGRVIVLSRTITGRFLSGDICGDFTVTYHADVSLSTQAGQLAGQLVRGEHKFKLFGQSQPVQLIPVPGGVVGKLTVTGGLGTGNGRQRSRLL